MKPITAILILIILLLGSYIAYQHYFKKGNDQSLFREAIKNLKEKLHDSKERERILANEVEDHEKKIGEHEQSKKEVERHYRKAIEKIKKAKDKTIDSLFYAFYPDSSRRDIVATHVEAEACDSVRAILVSHILHYMASTKTKDEIIAELKGKQIPTIVKIDSVEKKRERMKRFSVGPSITVGTNGKEVLVVPGVSLTYTLFKF